MFDLGTVRPEFQSAGQSLTQLFVDPPNWEVEAFRFGRAPSYEDESDRQLNYALYSLARERERYHKRDLVVDLKGLIRPDIWEEQQYLNWARDLRGNYTRAQLQPIPIPPFPIKAEPENPTAPYLIGGVAIRNFDLYLKFTRHPSGLEEYEDLVHDPRRVVAEVRLENPVARLKSRFSKGIGDLEEELKYLEENKDKIPSPIYQSVMSRLEQFARLHEGLIADLT